MAGEMTLMLIQIYARSLEFNELKEFEINLAKQK